MAARPRSCHMISPERDPVLKRLRRECIRCAEQMNMIRHDDVATDSPEICCLPSRDHSSRGILVRQQRSSPVRAYREENNDRWKAGFNRWKVRGHLSLISAGARPRVRRRRRASPSIRICLHPSDLVSPASNMRMRLSTYGKRIVSVRPLPWLLSIESSPPCSRTMRRTISNPRPVPDGLVVK